MTDGSETPDRPRRRPDEDTYYTRHDPRDAARLSTTVVHGLAEMMDVDVTNAGFQLADSIDPDALDRLFRPKDDSTLRPPGHITFTVEGHRVTVHSDGRIVIEAPGTS